MSTEMRCSQTSTFWNTAACSSLARAVATAVTVQQHNVIIIIIISSSTTTIMLMLTLMPLAGGNPRGEFGLARAQGAWQLYVSGPLDRERQDAYLLNVTASDGRYVARAAVEVTVTDANDNSPVCDQVGARLRPRPSWESWREAFARESCCHVIIIMSHTALDTQYYDAEAYSTGRSYSSLYNTNTNTWRPRNIIICRN